MLIWIQIINTVDPEFFKENIRKALEFRRMREADKNKRLVDINPELYTLIMNTLTKSQSKISVCINVYLDQRGRAVHLLSMGVKPRQS